VEPLTVSLLSEAETSGGLLVFVKEGQAEKALSRIRDQGDEQAAIIGHAERRQVLNEYLKVV